MGSENQYPKSITTLVLLMISACSQAEIHEVAVQDNNFLPSSLVIQAGDTVRWQNLGVNHHNVASTLLDYSFRCAWGCDNAGGNGTAAGNGWVAEVTFHQPIANVPYICEPHFNSGMTGSVVVQTPNEFETVSLSVANGVMPASLTIPQYSTVKFVNNGGEHNILADDDSFRCAVGCRDDGMLGQGNFTGFPWQLYLQFNQAGSFSYHCENPAHNETGVIHVIDDFIFANGFESN